MTIYKKLLYNGNKIQVDSAIRDGNGKDISEYQEKLTAGTNVNITNNIISSSASGGNYTLVTDKELKDFFTVSNETNNTITVTITKNLRINVIQISTSSKTFVNFKYIYLKKGSYIISNSSATTLSYPSFRISSSTYGGYAYCEFYVGNGYYRFRISTPNSFAYQYTSNSQSNTNNQITTEYIDLDNISYNNLYQLYESD